MTVTGIIFGHDVTFRDGQWLWADTMKPTDHGRLCPGCGQPPTSEGYDPCIGLVEGAISVCCGHGREAGYVVVDSE